MTDRSDHGPAPYVMNIEQATLANKNYRTTLWTGRQLQLTLMTILPGHDIGLEVHPDHDQFLRIEEGEATAFMGTAKNTLDTWKVKAEDAVLVPAGFWHNLVNTGDGPLKLYSIYAPPEHEPGTVHETKEDADNDPHEH